MGTTLASAVGGERLGSLDPKSEGSMVSLPTSIVGENVGAEVTGDSVSTTGADVGRMRTGALVEVVGLSAGGRLKVGEAEGAPVVDPSCVGYSMAGAYVGGSAGGLTGAGFGCGTGGGGM